MTARAAGRPAKQLAGAEQASGQVPSRSIETGPGPELHRHGKGKTRGQSRSRRFGTREALTVATEGRQRSFGTRAMELGLELAELRRGC
jgi:hypothetical protein